METQSPDRWIILRVRLVEEALWITYEDDAGTRRDPPERIADEPAGWVSFPPILVDQRLWPAGLQAAVYYAPADLKALIEEAIASLPTERFGPHANGPVPLPVFVDPPAELREYPWIFFLEKFLSSILVIEYDRIEALYLAGRRWVRRPPFRLPLRVLAIGPTCDQALGLIRSASWYSDDEIVQSHGLRLDTVEAGKVSRALRDEARDIVLLQEDAAEAVLASARRLARPEVTRPRLFIVLAEAAGMPNEKRLSLPPGTSLLWLAAADGDLAARFTKQFLYGIIHDYPLHEALKSAARDLGPFMTRYRFLFADPESNNYLRLSDALAQLHDETLTLSQTVARGDLDHFFARMGRDATEEFRSELSNALEMKEPIEQAVAHTRGLKIDFKRETEGLAPLAHAEASLDEAKQAEQRVREALSPILSNSDYVNAVQEHQDRRVDAALEELEPDTAIYRPVDPHLKLSKGWRYRLRVHIGQRSDDSLMVGEPPPLDPLLPEPEGEAGHKLEVVVFEKDFTLLSPRVQSLRLPPLRGSKPVYFELIAPELDEAELRIGIYHRNHLLQSFVLEAEIGTGDWVWHQEKQVRVRLNFSRTARFTNLNSLAPRAMSIGVNQDLAGAAHTFMLKRDDEALPVHLTEDILFKQVKEFREILQEATADSGGNPRFATYPQPGAPPSPDFEEVVRRLAEFGRELYRAIFIRSTRSMQKELRDIAGREDDTIQIVRHDPNFAFPWPVLYDFELPQKTAGAQPSPICLGGAGSAAGRTKLCSHGPKDKVYCIYGFWGLRHRVEQLVALGDNLQDAVDKVQPGTESGVCLAVGEIDEHTSRMASELRSKLGSAVVELMPEDDILDVLWQSQKRPAILVVLGHLETAKIDGEPEGPRIVLHPKKKWLQAAPITDRQILDGDWEQPRTLIMLMACGSAATDISTLNDLATAFNSVGAAAVVGTECAAFSRLVARFAEEVTADLWGGVSLGGAVMAFNRRLVNSGNPLAFVFSYLGDADLKIVAP